MTHHDPHESFLTLRRFLRIAHHVPGRLRVRIDHRAAKEADHGDLKRFRHLLESQPGVRSVRVNLLALSAVIDYDAEALSPSLWRRLVEGPLAEAKAVLEHMEHNLALAAGD